jgi:hypothetical protein
MPAAITGRDSSTRYGAMHRRVARYGLFGDFTRMASALDWREDVPPASWIKRWPATACRPEPGNLSRTFLLAKFALV